MGYHQISFFSNLYFCFYYYCMVSRYVGIFLNLMENSDGHVQLHKILLLLQNIALLLAENQIVQQLIWPASLTAFVPYFLATNQMHLYDFYNFSNIVFLNFFRKMIFRIFSNICFSEFFRKMFFIIFSNIRFLNFFRKMIFIILQIFVMLFFV